MTDVVCALLARVRSGPLRRRATGLLAALSLLLLGTDVAYARELALATYASGSLLDRVVRGERRPGVRGLRHAGGAHRSPELGDVGPSPWSPRPWCCRPWAPWPPTAETDVAGPPKRFAQGIGATLSVVAAVATFGFGAVGAGQVLAAMITVAATLESALGFCLGCWIFARLMHLGVVPESVCRECADLSSRLAPSG